ncbi:MAG: hypothetical protein ABI693_26715 [Bryobacteraceae bacterium]
MRRHGARIVWALLCSSALGQVYSSNPGTSWPAVDGLGRALPTGAEAGPARPNKFVGIFYFLWFGQHDRSSEGPFVVADILAKYPNALKMPGSPPWGPEESPHYWGEPLYGFYLNSDPWVLRRHAWMLADAGIDTLIFDATNRYTYREECMNLCREFRELRKRGEHTPQIVFMVNTDAGATAQDIYEDLYKPGLYDELWFRWQGKPLLICDPEKASAEVRAFFTLRRAHWPFEQVNTHNAWHWEAAYPQVYGFTDDPRAPEEVNVSVAQNLRQADGVVTNMSDGNARGRSFHNGSTDTQPGAVNHGFNFQEQFGRALALDPPFVMVTGWNEWIAGRFTRPGKDVVFVDQFSEEYSRDIEPMRGGHLDHYYYQLVANVRRFKGMPQERAAWGPKTIDIAGSMAQWRDVMPEFLDHTGETAPRDFDGVAKLHYTNKSGRNDFELMKVSHDEKYLYFYARTTEEITAPSGENWMTLLIDTGGQANWEGYSFAVNRSAPGILERSSGGWNWARAATVPYRVVGREIHVAVPRAALGLAEGKTPLAVKFKWVDNLQKPGDIMDFYVSGDVAPEGRFQYRYVTK